MDQVLIFFQSFFGAPAILVALFALVGSILNKQKPTQCLIATFTAAVGFFGITAGAGIISQGLTNFGTSFQILFNLSGTFPSSDITAANVMKVFNDIASTASLLMLCAMVLNIALARTSRFKYIFLTGHHALYMSVMIVAFFQAAGYNVKTDMWLFLLGGSALMAVYMTLSPALSKPYMEFLTKDNKMYIGHFNSFGFAIAGAIGTLYGKMKRGKIVDAEKIKLPKWLMFFRYQVVSLSLTMLLIFMILYISIWSIHGIDFMIARGIINSGESPITKAFTDAFLFTIGVEVLIFGVKMMLGELMPAIEGVGKKFIKNAKVGVDCGVVLYYQPTSVLIGFISSFLGGMIGMGITIGFNLVDAFYFPSIILPGVVSHFFTGGTSGTFANIKGGVGGAFFGSLIQGLIQTLIPAFFIAMQIKWGIIFGVADPNVADSIWNTMYTELDFLVVLAPLGLIAALVPGGVWIIVAVSWIVYFALMIDGLIKEVRDKKNNKGKIDLSKTEIDIKNENKEFIKQKSKKSS